MATSTLFNNYSTSGLTGEQLILEDMINEIVHVRGHDCYYIVRETGDVIDYVLGEDPTSKFEKLYSMEMLITATSDWTSGNNILTKFGLQINKSTELIIPRRVFNKYVPESVREKPKEGDLIYIPAMQKLFEIKYSTPEKDFFKYGRPKNRPYFYEIELEMFKYSHETFNTGFEDFDNIEREIEYIIDLAVSGGSINFIIDEPVYEGNTYNTATATAEVAKWDIANSVVSVYNIKGEFTSTSNITGMYSGAVWTISTYDDKQDSSDVAFYQNAEIENSANDFIQTTETNPFGNIVG